MYDTGATYAEVLLALFGAKSSAVVAHHKKNKDFNNNLNQRILSYKLNYFSLKNGPRIFSKNMKCNQNE